MKFLDIKYSKYDPDNKSWKNGLLSAVVILLLLVLLQPFGFRDKGQMLKMILFPVYGLLAFLLTTSNFYVIRHIIKKKKTWTLKNEIIAFLPHILFSTLIIHLFTVWITGDMPFNIQWYLKLFYHIFSLFLVIIIIEFLFYSNKSANRENQQLASDVQMASQKLKNSIGKEDEIITVSLEKNNLEINRNKIIFIQSWGNYLDFYLREDDGKMKKITKRGRLHQAEKDLKSFSEFFRCHRAFIINLKQVKNIRGNVKNAKVVLVGNPMEIPVSRSLYKNLKEHFEKITLR
jgi:uncharacterized membrane protein